MIKELTTKNFTIHVASESMKKLLEVKLDLDFYINDLNKPEIVDHFITEVHSVYQNPNSGQFENDTLSLQAIDASTVKQINDLIKYKMIELRQEVKK